MEILNPRSTAALRGTGIKELILHAVEREVGRPFKIRDGQRRRVTLPIVNLKSRRKIDLTGFDSDDLPA